MTTVGKFLVCGFEDGSISVFSVDLSEGLSLERSNKLHSKPISCITSTPAHQKRLLLFTGYSSSSQSSIIIWDFHSLKPLKELCGHSATVSCIEFLTSNYLISTSYDRRIIFWDLGECEAAICIEAHNSAIISAYYDSVSNILYTGSIDSCIVQCGLVMEDGELLDCKILKTIQGGGSVLCLAGYPDNKLISFQNSKLVMYDSRGVVFREIKTNSLPNNVEMLGEDRCVLVDIYGTPHVFDITHHINNNEGVFVRREGAGGKKEEEWSIDKSSVYMSMRLNGVYSKAQIIQTAAYCLVVSTNEKSDTIYFYIVK